MIDRCVPSMVEFTGLLIVGQYPLYYLLCIIPMWLWSYNSGECVIVWMVTSLTSNLQRW